MAIYLKNKDLYKEIIISKELGRLTPEAEKMLILLAKNIMKKFSYTSGQDKEDCFSEGLYQLFKNWHNFNENKTDNAFAFYTEIFKRGVAQGYNKVYKKDYITDEYYRPIAFSHLFSDENSEIRL
jgi:hypothetical protein